MLYRDQPVQNPESREGGGGKGVTYFKRSRFQIQLGYGLQRARSRQLACDSVHDEKAHKSTYAAAKCIIIL